MVQVNNDGPQDGDRERIASEIEVARNLSLKAEQLAEVMGANKYADCETDYYEVDLEAIVRLAAELSDQLAENVHFAFLVSEIADSEVLRQIYGLLCNVHEQVNDLMAAHGAALLDDWVHCDRYRNPREFGTYVGLLKLTVRKAVLHPAPRQVFIQRSQQMAGEPTPASAGSTPVVNSSAGTTSENCTKAAREAKQRAEESQPAVTAPDGDGQNDDSQPRAPQGFLGGTELRNALSIPTERVEAFFKALERKRRNLGDECWHEVRDRRPNSPQFIYRVDSPALRELADRYRTPNSA